MGASRATLIVASLISFTAAAPIAYLIGSAQTDSSKVTVLGEGTIPHVPYHHPHNHYEAKEAPSETEEHTPETESGEEWPAHAEPTIPKSELQAPSEPSESSQTPSPPPPPPPGPSHGPIYE